MDTPFFKQLLSRILFWVIPLFVIVATIFFFLGFRISSRLHVLTPGTLSITIPHADTNIYLDKKFIGKSTGENQTITRSHISPGRHTVGVEKNGYWPWYKEIVIESKQTLTLNPFTVNKNPSGTIITEADLEYFKIDAMIEEATRSTTLKDQESNTTLIKEGGALYLNSKDSPPIFISKDPIRSFAFFPDHYDVALIAVDNGIYALELTTDKQPNFQPLYKGLSPSFVTTPNHSVLIKDLGTLMELSW